MHVKAEELIEAFHAVAELANMPSTRGLLSYEWLPAPHRATGLAFGNMAVYSFFLGDVCLKVGKAGPNSGPRYQNHHYSPTSSNSNLAGSILAHPNFIPSLPAFENPPKQIGTWLRESTCRLNFIMPSSLGIPLLSLLEVFVQCRFLPLYEGFKSQR